MNTKSILYWLTVITLLSLGLSACGGPQDAVQSGFETAIAPVYVGTSALWDTPTPTPAAYIPPEGHSFVGIMNPGDTCGTPGGYETNNLGNVTREGNVDLQVVTPTGKTGLYTLTGPTSVYTVDGFIFVNPEGETVQVFAPNGQVCIWFEPKTTPKLEG